MPEHSSADRDPVSPQPRIDDTVYVFHHIPRCGGTSCREAFSEWFHITDDYRQGWDSGDALQQFQQHPVELSLLRAGDMLAGHYEVEGSFLWQRYPEILADPRYQLLTFVRDPLEMAISTYRYELKEGQLEGQTLEQRLCEGTSNTLARIFGVTEESYEHILDERYLFIGIQERLQESVDCLASLIKKPPIVLPKLNDTTQNRSPLGIDTIQVFAEQNKLDYDIYQYCVERLNHALAD